MYRVVGTSGLRVSTLGLGTATFGVAPPRVRGRRLVDKALSAGINYIETANTYGNQARFDRTGLPGWRERRSAEEIVGGCYPRPTGRGCPGDESFRSDRRRAQ